MTLKKFIFPTIALFVVSLSACITPFTPQGIKSEVGTLVIEGDIILQGSTKVYISLLQALDNSEVTKFITDALVWVEDINGKGYTGSIVTDYNAFPYYLIDTETLSFDYLYKLCVSLSDGQRYESDYLTPLLTPEIDSIDFLVNDTQTQVDFVVTTYGEEPVLHSSFYYKWRYTEDWEVQSYYNTYIYYDTISMWIKPFYETHSLNNPFFYCWNKGASSSILIAKTDHLEHNLVYQQRLHTVDHTDDRISSLYFINVSQMSISLEAYTYLSNLKKNTDEVGGLFPLRPFEVYGNIHCISHPGTKVIGYISAGTITSKSLFVSAEELEIYVRPFDCRFIDWRTRPFPMPWTFLYEMGARIVGSSPSVTFYEVEWAPPPCVDCTQRGTKIKPSFWPNDHL